MTPNKWLEERIAECLKKIADFVNGYKLVPDGDLDEAVTQWNHGVTTAAGQLLDENDNMKAVAALRSLAKSVKIRTLREAQESCDEFTKGCLEAAQRAAGCGDAKDAAQYRMDSHISKQLSSELAEKIKALESRASLLEKEL